MQNKSTVLITGTTSGIGLELSRQYIDLGFNVIAVDRNKNNQFENNRNFFQEIIDITKINEVEYLIKKIETQKIIVDIFILNAGISDYDNIKFFDVRKFKENFDVNFYGVMNFVSEIDKNFSGKKVVFFSSVSRYVPNSSILSYFISKDLLFKLVKFLNMNSKSNVFKVIILGPVKSKISRNLNEIRGLSKFIYNFLIVDTKTAVKNIIKFNNNNNKYFYYTKVAYLVCKIISLFLLFFPNLNSINKKK